MKEIPLTQGKVAIVDDDMYDYLSQWKWYARKDGKNWYAQRNDGIKPFRKLVLMHREITNAPNGMDVDHWNRNGLDNRRENLRVCTRTENSRNAGLRITNKSGYKGVCWNKQHRVYDAHIRVDGKFLYLGSFSDSREAARAYDAAAKKHYGEFAWLNFQSS